MSLLSEEFQSFHEDRVQSNVNDVQSKYSLGKREFDKYDIEDNWNGYTELVLDEAHFTRCVVEACFTNCSFKNVLFSHSNLKTVSFMDCDLTNMTINECSIESIDFTNSVLQGLKFGTNYAYGATLNSEALTEIYLPKLVQ